jgi:predicted DNA-binding ribbon-helix-helix protein
MALVRELFSTAVEIPNFSSKIRLSSMSFQKSMVDDITTVPLR